jgi:hypothetical protein
MTKIFYNNLPMLRAHLARNIGNLLMWASA